MKRKLNHESRKVRRIEKKLNRKNERGIREGLKAQERGRKEHIKRQAPEVQERMKKSLEESERTRRHKTFWERLMFWKRTKSKEKRL
jgi:hypothetical protein